MKADLKLKAKCDKSREKYKGKKSIYDLCEDHVAVSWSGGKDSTAVLVRMVEEGIHIDEVIFSDTEYEFEYLHEYMKEVIEYINKIDDKIKFTTINNVGTLEDWAYGTFTRGKNKGMVRGFPTTIGFSYCTRELKVVPIQSYIKEMKIDKTVYTIIGIAFDEPNRITKTETYLYPLVEWEMTEAYCIEFLKKRDLHNKLYDKYSRLGCWFCPKQNNRSLKTMITDHPDKWERVKEWEKEFTKLGSPYCMYRIYGTEVIEKKLFGVV